MGFFYSFILWSQIYQFELLTEHHISENIYLRCSKKINILPCFVCMSLNASYHLGRGNNVGLSVLNFVQKQSKTLMEAAQFRFIVCKLASQRIQLHFGMLNLYKQKSSLSSLQKLTIA